MHALHHASSRLRTIDIICEAAASDLRVEVRDERYRTQAIRGRPKPPQAAAEGEGLGIFLIQALMDNLEVNVDQKLGTELVMTKRVGA